VSAAKTVSEQILSRASGTDARAGDIVVCDVDLVLGTDASSPMAIDYFEKMGGRAIWDPSRVMFAFDHYAPPSGPRPAAFHERVRAFAKQHGATLHEVGQGISFQIAGETGRVRAGDLVIGADSHTVTLGALGAFATGVGSSDLAAAMITGRIWLRVPQTLVVDLPAGRPRGVAAKDVALAMAAALGAEGANYQALEFHGGGVSEWALEERFVISNLAVESGAKTALWVDAPTPTGPGVSRTITIDVPRLTPRVAVPHSPNDVVPVGDVAGTPVQMVFLGTCTGGRVSDFHDALEVLERGGGAIAAGVQLVVTPASRIVYERLIADGSLAKFVAMGAVVTTPGCGACCGTGGAIPGDGMTVLSTANRNFKARMGNASASIYLASPAACAAAALTGVITDPREIG
jgi:3-isopropylmalate/(R)-2-methylmalate dehydratase large subunit